MHMAGYFQDIVTHALRQCVEHENERYLYALQRTKRTPVAIDELMSSESPFGNSGMGIFSGKISAHGDEDYRR